jgi:DNA-binding response OmpR family regulator
VEDGRLLAQAVRDGHAQFQLRAVPGYHGLIDYLCGHEPYGDRVLYPVPEVILIEYALGSLKGTEVLRWVRGNQEFAKWPLVMFSAITDLHVVGECYALGADYYLAKPMRREDLIGIVRRLDICLGTTPPHWVPLRDIATQPELARLRLRIELRESVAENKELRQEQRALSSGLDLTMAERKEALKKFPFTPKEDR